MKSDVREAWLEEEIYFLLWLHYNMIDEYELTYKYEDLVYYGMLKKGF